MTSQKTQFEQESHDKQMHDATCQHQSTIDALRSALNQALIGKDEIIEMVLACLLARGHLLFDDLPGLGKTIGKGRGPRGRWTICPRTVHP